MVCTNSMSYGDLREQIYQFCEQCKSISDCMLAREDPIVIVSTCYFSKRQFEGRRF